MCSQKFQDNLIIISNYFQRLLEYWPYLTHTWILFLIKSFSSWGTLDVPTLLWTTWWWDRKVEIVIVHARDESLSVTIPCRVSTDCCCWLPCWVLLHSRNLSCGGPLTNITHDTTLSTTLPASHHQYSSRNRTQSLEDNPSSLAPIRQSTDRLKHFSVRLWKLS